MFFLKVDAVAIMVPGLPYTYDNRMLIRTCQDRRSEITPRVLAVVMSDIYAEPASIVMDIPRWESYQQISRRVAGLIADKDHMHFGHKI